MKTRKGLFLELDNVVVRTKSGRAFPLHSEDWELNTSVLQVIKDAHKIGYTIFIVTNQEEVGEGFKTEFSFKRRLENIVNKIETIVQRKRFKIYYAYCTSVAFDFRKMPMPSMAYELSTATNTLLKDSLMLGVKDIHKTFAYNAGIGYYCNIKELQTLKAYLNDISNSS